jgi:hypothetical protein
MKIVKADMLQVHEALDITNPETISGEAKVQ